MPKSNVPKVPISNKKPKPIGMRDEDEINHPNVVMMAKKKTAPPVDMHVMRKEVDLTFAPLTKEEKLEY